MTHTKGSWPVCEASRCGRCWIQRVNELSYSDMPRQLLSSFTYTPPFLTFISTPYVIQTSKFCISYAYIFK